jgi:hypothetical protein
MNTLFKKKYPLAEIEIYYDNGDFGFYVVANNEKYGGLCKVDPDILEKNLWKVIIESLNTRIEALCKGLGIWYPEKDLDTFIADIIIHFKNEEDFDISKYRFNEKDWVYGGKITK